MTSDTVAIQHVDARVVIPRAAERALAAAAPRGVDVCDEELLLRRPRHLELDRQRSVEGIAVLRVEVLTVLLRWEPSVTVARNDEEAIRSRHALPSHAAGFE
jgi:hypothetical protein